MAAVQRPSSPAATTTTQTQVVNRSSPLRRTPIVGTLVLRGEPRSPRQRIRWADDVVDNEGLGRKSSKVCCIYHKPKPAGESSDESSSSSSESDSDSEPDNSKARMSGRRRPQRRSHAHDHDHDDECASDGSPAEGGGRRHRQQRRPSPNAYERIPTVKRKKGSKGNVTQVVQGP